MSSIRPVRLRGQSVSRAWLLVDGHTKRLFAITAHNRPLIRANPEKYEYWIKECVFTCGARPLSTTQTSLNQQLAGTVRKSNTFQKSKIHEGRTLLGIQAENNRSKTYNRMYEMNTSRRGAENAEKTTIVWNTNPR
jgi:hypothetical protein